jgi:hypothetical protein
MRVKRNVMAILVVSVLLGTIGIASAAGLYVTKKGGGGGSPLPSTADAMPSDIKGSSTFGTVANGFDIPLAELGTAFRIPEGTSVASFQLKGLEALGLSGEGGLEVGVASVRWFVALYKGLEYAPAETTGLPPEAVSILLEKAPLDDADRALLEERTTGGA